MEKDKKKEDSLVGKVIASRTVPVRSCDFSRTLFDGLAKAPSKVIIRDILLKREATSREIVERSQTLARHLLRIGCSRGDVIAIFSQNSIEWLVVMAAAFRIGAIPAGINALTRTELPHYIQTCEAKYLYTEQSLAPLAIKAIRDSQLKIVVVANHGHPDCISLESLLEANEALPLPTFDELRLKPSDPGLILFSSGTTGLPKAVLLSHLNLQASDTFQEQPESNMVYDNQLLLTPFSHAMGGLWLLAACTRGFATNFMARFDFIKLLEYVEANRLENLFLVTPITVMLAKDPAVDRFRLDSIKSILTSGATLSADVVEQLTERFPRLKIRQGFGMTELSGMILVVPDREVDAKGISSFSSMWKRKRGSVGVAVCNTEAKVIDLKTGLSLGPGQQGELCMRSINVMLGYLNNPEAMAQMIEKDGWMHTGDIAYYDEDGYFFIVDRLKEIIRYNAYQVSPAEMEAVLLSHPDVADAGVFGIPDEVSGELPTAAIVLRSGSKLTESELQKFVTGQVAPYKRLRGGIRFVDGIPKNPSGKILRRELKANMLKPRL